MNDWTFFVVLRRILSRTTDVRRIQVSLALFFVALAIPAGALVWHAYTQLRWESFHRTKLLAEDVTAQINRRLDSITAQAESRTFADYSFLVVVGDPSANFIQRSPLSVFPAAQEIPGTLGYFQVDSTGVFSTPHLPGDLARAELVGISPDELTDRTELASALIAILSENQLIDNTPPPEELDLDHELKAVDMVTKELSDEAVDGVVASDLGSSLESVRKDDTATDYRLSADAELSAKKRQQAFDKLSEIRRRNQSVPSSASPGLLSEITVADEDKNLDPKKTVTSLGLDVQLQSKSERQEAARPTRELAERESNLRPTRKEQAYVPEPAEETSTPISDTQAAHFGITIKAFESELDPFEFSLLGSGHFVMFRKVWREQERFVQGALIDAEAFIEDIITRPFQSTQLSGWADLVVSDQDIILSMVESNRLTASSSTNEGYQPALLDRSPLTAPYDSLELVYSVKSLPAGPGANILAWVSVVLFMVLFAGFIGLYRTSLRQIALARQKQDFVSAISHELKTPLTSIRMYGEMLKNNWVDEKKKQSYYDYIFEESERLSRMINSVLQLASISQNRTEPEWTIISTDELMDQVKSRILSQFSDTEFELDWSHNAEQKLTFVKTDPDCFIQIAINLVDNAIKFSHSADIKKILVSGSVLDERQFVFTVRDYGSGIPRNQLNKIFDMFYRTENELTRETVGTGIGLAIVKQLCELIGARVKAANRSPGAEFSVMLSLDCGATGPTES